MRLGLPRRELELRSFPRPNGQPEASPRVRANGQPKAPARVRPNLGSRFVLCRPISPLHPFLFLLLPLLLTLFAVGCGSESTTTPEEPVLTGFEGAFGTALVAGGVHPNEVILEAIGSDGTRPFPFSGNAALSLSTGTVNPTSVEFVDGVAEFQLEVDGAYGEDLVLSAQSGSVTSAIALPPVLLAELLGDDEEMANEVIPEFPLRTAQEDYVFDHPEGGEVGVSPNVLLLQFTPETSVGDANELLESLGAMVAGGAGKMVALRLPDTNPDQPGNSSELDALLVTLRADPRVQAVAPDVLLGETVISRDNGGNPSAWTWEATPGTGNWGHERIRVPAMWNLNDALDKHVRTTRIGVLDTGFDLAHDDLSLIPLFNDAVTDHGTHVAGIIGAKFDNGLGVDGVLPNAFLHTQSVYAGLASRNSSVRASSGQVLTSSLLEILDHEPPVRVVNVSMGYNWYKAGINPDNSVFAQETASAHGEFVAQILEGRRNRSALPIICAAAGNEGSAGVTPSARWSSPLTNASLDHGVSEILVVENVDDSPGTGTGNVSRSISSCIDGDLSAPGEDVLSTISGNGYGPKSGTSMAAPYVTGLIGYLLALDPALSNEQVVDLLLDNTRTAGGGASGVVDAWATAVDIDRIRGGNQILTWLVDIDDGSLDGNLRVDPDTFLDELSEDLDGDGGPGDGTVDMSDFRRFRDWLLQSEGGADVSFSGSANHPKRDPNGNGRVEGAADEAIFSRGDFNGDGKISRSDTAPFPGRIGRDVTDLEVLQELFSDPDYDAADLPGLIESADFTLDATGLVELEGAAEIRFEIRRASDDVRIAERTFSSSRTMSVVTVPVEATGHVLFAEVRDSDGTQIFDKEEELILSKGQDHTFAPNAEPVLFIELSAPARTPVQSAFPISVRAGFEEPNGDRTVSNGLQITFTGTGLSVSPPTGSTDSDGEFGAEGTLHETTETTVLFATVSSPGFDDVVASARIDAQGSVASVYLTARRSVARSHAVLDITASAGNPDVYETRDFEEDVTDPTLLEVAWAFSGSASGATMYGDRNVSGQCSASLAFETEIEMAGNFVASWSGSGAMSGSASQSGFHQFRSDSAFGHGSAIESLDLQVTAPTRVVGEISVFSADGIGETADSDFQIVTSGNRPLWIRVSGGDGPQAVDLVLEPGLYKFTASTRASASVQYNFGSSATANSAIEWNLRFEAP